MKTTQLSVKGMHCVNCARTAERLLSKVPGVQEAHVDFATGKARVIHDAAVTVTALTEAVADAGYEAAADEEQESGEEDPALKKERQRLIISWSIALPFMIAMISMYGFNVMLIPMEYEGLITVAGSFIVLLFAGMPVLRATFFSFKTMMFTMDSLIGIGSIAALASGILHIANFPIENFSMISSMIIAINNTGNYIKLRSTKKAGDAVKKLAGMSAKSAHKLIDGSLVDIPIKLLVPGDIVLVKPGEIIPSDGVIVKGITAIDESIATGESIPVDKAEGSKVLGGTINQVGAVEVKIEKTGNDTFIAQVIHLIEQAQASKIPIQQFADKITNIFVPVILVLSVSSFLFWMLLPESSLKVLASIQKLLPWVQLGSSRLSMALFSAIATLVIACPCALGLATPTALMVGISMGAQRGILIRSGDAIQEIRNADVIVFDKTGTLTTGKPTVSKYITDNERELFLTAYLLEKNSEHPLAHAIADYSYKKLVRINRAKNEIDIELKNYTVEKFSANPGMGAEAILNGENVYAGSLSFLETKGIPVNAHKSKFEEIDAAAATIVGLVKNNTLLGVFILEDTLKPDTYSVIQSLKALGFSTMMLSGDTKASAQKIGTLAGIDNIKAELLPHDKIEEIKKLQDSGHKVIMVGDGINDAPALKQADVGIAIGTGTDIAISSADITLVQGKLESLTAVIQLARAMFKKIKQNLFWAFFYNLVAIPLAMLGMLHPVIAESAMALSSVSVVSNSLRLRKLQFTIKH